MKRAISLSQHPSNSSEIISAEASVVLEAQRRTPEPPNTIQSPELGVYVVDAQRSLAE